MLRSSQQLIALLCTLTLSYSLAAGSHSSQAKDSSRMGRRVKEITEVKERHEKFLLSLPQVAGVGVGLSQVRRDTVVILIYVKRALKRKERKAFPNTLEGVPVEVIVSGPFRALPETSVPEKTDKR